MEEELTALHPYRDRLPILVFPAPVVAGKGLPGERIRDKARIAVIAPVRNSPYHDVLDRSRRFRYEPDRDNALTLWPAPCIQTCPLRLQRDTLSVEFELELTLDDGDDREPRTISQVGSNVIRPQGGIRWDDMREACQTGQVK